jgi:hypothetical protein
LNSSLNSRNKWWCRPLQIQRAINHRTQI